MSCVILVMWLAASVNMLRVGYQYSESEISVNLPVKLTVASLLLLWYCVSSGLVFVVRLVSPLDLVRFDVTPSELVGSLQPFNCSTLRN